MLKSIKNFGELLTKQEQKEINGGFDNPAGRSCRTNLDCYEGHPYLGPGDVSCRVGFFSGGAKACFFN